MEWLARGFIALLLALAPSLARADDPDGGAGEPSIAMPTEAPTPEAAPISGSRVHPYGLAADGWLTPGFEGPWRFRIALNGWMPNEILVTADDGSSRETLEKGLGWLLTNLEYYFPVDFEMRKGPFGVFAHTLFVRIAGAEEVVGSLEFDWSNTISLIDTGVSYELGRWPLTGDSAGPAVTVEPFVGARILLNPVEVSFGPLSNSGDLDTTVPLIGLRTHWDLTEHWNLRVAGDYGGFGVDDNHQTWQALGLIGYRIPGWGAHWNLQVGYRAMRLFDLRREIEVQMDMRGAVVVGAVEF